MGIPRTKIRLNASGQRGVRHAFVQLKKVRMSMTDAEPNNLRAAFSREGSNSVERKKKAREPNRAQLDAQPLFRFRCYISKKSERKMKLFRGQPTHTGQPRIQARERLRNRWR